MLQSPLRRNLWSVSGDHHIVQCCECLQEVLLSVGNLAGQTNPCSINNEVNGFKILYSICLQLCLEILHLLNHLNNLVFFSVKEALDHWPQDHVPSLWPWSKRARNCHLIQVTLVYGQSFLLPSVPEQLRVEVIRVFCSGCHYDSAGVLPKPIQRKTRKTSCTVTPLQVGSCSLSMTKCGDSCQSWRRTW